MTIFASAVDLIFGDRNMAADATYIPASGGAPVVVRAIRQVPDDRLNYGQSMIQSDTLMIDIRASEVSAPDQDATLVLDGISYLVSAEPIKDREGLIWTLELMPQ